MALIGAFGRVTRRYDIRLALSPINLQQWQSFSSKMRLL